MKKIAFLFGLVIGLVLPISVFAQNTALTDVYESCGYEVFSHLEDACTGCHTGQPEPTFEQTLYLTEGACAFCPEVTTCSSGDPAETELYADAQATTKAYFETLFKEFMMAMGRTGMMNPDGTPNNPAVFATVFPECPKIAPVIASDFSRDTGYLVRRVTNKTRNSRNIPDSWELDQLNKFDAMAAEGLGMADERRVPLVISKPNGDPLPTKEYESFEIVEEAQRGKDRIKYFRYMRSITLPPVTVLPCMKCHGTPNADDPMLRTAPGVIEAIQEHYPHDKALGYKPGDIRGAWSIKIPLGPKIVK